MKNIHKGNGFAIIEEGEKIQITWQQGPYGQPVFFDVSKENMKKALKSDQDAYEVMAFAETGKWPLGKDEQLEKNKEFVRQFPELLIKVPENQSLLDKDELKTLLEQVKNNIK